MKIRSSDNGFGIKIELEQQDTLHSSQYFHLFLITSASSSGGQVGAFEFEFSRTHQFHHFFSTENSTKKKSGAFFWCFSKTNWTCNKASVSRSLIRCLLHNLEFTGKTRFLAICLVTRQARSYNIEIYAFFCCCQGFFPNCCLFVSCFFPEFLTYQFTRNRC